MKIKKAEERAYKNERMVDKTKILFLPFNFVCLALILLSIFDKNGAKGHTTIQNNLAFATFPSTDPTKRYIFIEGGRNIN